MEGRSQIGTRNRLMGGLRVNIRISGEMRRWDSKVCADWKIGLVMRIWTILIEIVGVVVGLVISTTKSKQIQWRDVVEEETGRNDAEIGVGYLVR